MTLSAVLEERDALDRAWRLFAEYTGGKDYDDLPPAIQNLWDKLAAAFQANKAAIKAEIEAL